MADKKPSCPYKSYEETQVGVWEIPTIEDFKQFRESCLSDEGFVPAHSAKEFNLKVWTKKMDNSAIQVVRVRAEFPDVEPEILYDVLHDHEYRKTWDESMIEGYVIEMLGKNVEIGYYAAKSPVLTVSNRDYCNLRAWHRFKKQKEWAIFNFSVKHPQCPEKKDFVRGWSFRTGYFIQKNESGGSIFTYYTQNDFRGWIPAFVVNYIVTKFAPSVIGKLRKVALEYPEWKAKNNPDHKPWLDDREKKEKKEKKEKDADESSDDGKKKKKKKSKKDSSSDE